MCVCVCFSSCTTFSSIREKHLWRQSWKTAVKLLNFLNCVYMKKTKQGYTGLFNSSWSSWMISGAMQDLWWVWAASCERIFSQCCLQWLECVSRFLLCDNDRFCTILRWVSSVFDCILFCFLVKLLRTKLRTGMSQNYSWYFPLFIINVLNRIWS